MANIMSTTGIFCCKGKFVNHQGGQTTCIHLGSHILDWFSSNACLTRLDNERTSVQEVSGTIHLVCSFPDAFTFNIQPSTLQMQLCSHFVSFLFLCTFDLPFTFLPLESSWLVLRDYWNHQRIIYFSFSSDTISKSTKPELNEFVASSRTVGDVTQVPNLSRAKLSLLSLKMQTIGNLP